MHTWMPNPNFGFDMSSEMGLIPLVALPALISYLGVSIFNVQKVLLVSWFLILSFSTFMFFWELFPKRDQWIIRLTGTFIYLFNFHIYSFWLQGEQPMLSSYVILPLFALILYRFAVGKTGLFKTAVLLNIVYLFFSSGGIRGVPLIGPVILTSLSMFAYFVIINWKEKGFSYVVRFIYLGLLFVLILLPLNGYWIFPFISSFSHEFNNQVTIAGGKEGAISWARFVSTHDSFLNLFRLQGDNNWYSTPFLWSNAYLTNPFLILASFIFPTLAFLAPLFAKDRLNRKIILLFAALALISLFFAAGAHPPFGGIYIYMMEHIPGFATFRSAYYKFMPNVYFSFGVLVGYSVYSLSLRFKNKARVLTGVLFLLFILTYHYPYFQNTNAAFNKPFTTLLKVPDYVTEFGKMIDASNIREKTLVVPQTNVRNTIKTYTWGYYGSFSLFALMTDKPFVQYDAYLFNDSANALINTMYNKLREQDFVGFNRVAGITGIKYILLTKDTAYNYQLAPQEIPSTYEKILSDERYFKKIWSRGEWVFYEIIDKNIQPVVSVIPDVSVIRPNASELSTYFSLSSNSFVLADQIDSAILKKLEKSEELVGHPCISCTLLTVQELPKIEYQNVLPGSLLYSLKLKRDDELFAKATTSEQRVDVALGLSIKRVSELFGIAASPYTEEELSKFINPARLMLGYWDVVDEYLKRDLLYPDYTMIEKIHRYAFVQNDALERLSKSGVASVSPELSSTILDVSTKMSEIDSKLVIILEEKDWVRNFLYKVDKNKNIEDLSVSWLRQDKMRDELYIEPIVTMEEETSGYEKVSALSYYHLKDGKMINVEVQNVPDILIDKRTETISMPGSNKVCIVYTVDKYRFDKKYYLSVAALDEKTPKAIYVKMARGSFKTQDTKPVDLNLLNPYFTFVPVNKKDAVSEFEFTGQPNDKSASLYLCTDDTFDPEQAFSDVTLREQITPDLYSFTTSEQKKNTLPTISYKKINATKYTVSVKNAKEPYILSFLQTSSPNWILTINGLEQKDKFMLNGFANGWLIDEKGNYEMVLEFRTQQAFHKGIAVTIISFSLVLVYLLWNKLKTII